MWSTCTHRRIALALLTLGRRLGHRWRHAESHVARLWRMSGLLTMIRAVEGVAVESRGGFTGVIWVEDKAGRQVGKHIPGKSLVTTTTALDVADDGQPSRVTHTHLAAVGWF